MIFGIRAGCIGFGRYQSASDLSNRFLTGLAERAFIIKLFLDLFWCSWHMMSISKVGHRWKFMNSQKLNIKVSKCVYFPGKYVCPISWKLAFGQF